MLVASDERRERRLQARLTPPQSVPILPSDASSPLPAQPGVGPGGGAITLARRGGGPVSIRPVPVRPTPFVRVRPMSRPLVPAKPRGNKHHHRHRHRGVSDGVVLGTGYCSLQAERCASLYGTCSYSYRRCLRLVGCYY